MYDPILLCLRNSAQRPKVVVLPASIARVGAAAPRGMRNVIIYYDCDPRVCKGLYASFENVEGAQTHQIGIGGEQVGEHVRIANYKLVGIREAHAVEAKAADSLGYYGTVLHIEAARDEELVRGAVPVDAGQFKAAAGGVDNIAATGA